MGFMLLSQLQNDFCWLPEFLENIDTMITELSNK